MFLLVVDGYGSKAGADPDIWRAGLAVGLYIYVMLILSILLCFILDLINYNTLFETYENRKRTSSLFSL